MKYEFIWKTRKYRTSPFEIKYSCCNVPESDFEFVKSKYEKAMSSDPEGILLINKLDDDGDFIEVIQ